MLKSHKYWLGLFWLAVILILPLPLIQTLAQGMNGTVNQGSLLSSQLGTIAYVWMLFAIIVSEKPKWLDKLIGLPEMYFAHGIIGTGAVIIAYVHSLLSPSTGIIQLTGNIALYTFIGVLVYSIFFMSSWFTSRSELMKKIKKQLEKIFKYETSIWLHRLNLVATLFVFGHVILIDYINSITPFMIWFYIYSGLTAAIYFYAQTVKKLFRNEGTLIGNQQITSNIGQLTIEISGSKTFQPGDYVFISFPKVEGMKEPHPFSILNFDQTKKELTFAIRNEQDFTKKFKQLKIGTEVLIDGTYGRLYQSILEHKDKRLVLIGSGIGSVPLISLATSLLGKMPITFIRVAHLQQDLIYESYLQNLNSNGLNYKSQIGRLNEKQIESLSDSNSFYLIGGSREMMRGTEKMLVKNGVLKKQIYGEKFSF